jgi:hypothetical protein
VADLLVDGVSKGALISYNFTNVTANHTISATFGKCHGIRVIDHDDHGERRR